MRATRTEISDHAEAHGWTVRHLTERSTNLTHHDGEERVGVHITWTPRATMSTISAYRDGLTAAYLNTTVRDRFTALLQWLDNPADIPPLPED